MRNFVLSWTVVVFCLQMIVLSDDQRRQTVRTSASGYTTRILDQVNPEHGAFELKKTDRNGRVTEWYQNFADEEGKVLIEIIREVPGWDEKPPYESIQFIQHNVYRPDGNISEYYSFTGDGVLRKRVIYKYDEKGKWLEGIKYNAQGKVIGKELTAPEARLYGDKKKK